MEAMGEQFLRQQGLSLILETSLDTILESNQTLKLKNVVTLCFFLRLVSAYLTTQPQPSCISNFPATKRSLF